MTSLITPRIQANRELIPTASAFQQKGHRHWARLRWFKTVESLKPFVAAWDALAERASEPNVFLESWYLLPALELLRGSADVSIGLVTEPSISGRDNVIGVFPMEHISPNLRWPLGGMRTWRHPQCFLCTPLMSPGREELCWELLLNDLDKGQFGRALELPVLSADGPVFEGLLRCTTASHRPVEIQNIYSRGVMRLDSDSRTYLNKGSVARREYGRKMRKLAQMGVLQATSLDSCENHLGWIDEFLDLEARGWKGAAHSAMACNAADRQFITRIADAAHSRGRLMMFALRLDGQLLAGELNLAGTRGSCFGLKIAFDEGYAEYSPGMVLSLEGVHLMHAERRVEWIDCCCAPGNDSIKRLWNEHRLIASVALPATQKLATLAFASRPLARWVHHLFRSSEDQSQRKTPLPQA